PVELRQHSRRRIGGEPGFGERANLITSMACFIKDDYPFATLSDLGCGDGTLMQRVAAATGCQAWGYDLGEVDLAAGRMDGLDVRQADIVRGDLIYGDLVMATEVLEHLADPEAFLLKIPSRMLLVSSPAAETGDWH